MAGEGLQGAQRLGDGALPESGPPMGWPPFGPEVPGSLAAHRVSAMMLSPGSCLGPYEILAPLGAGGMGEVYRAQDTKLKREVAIKVLPESVAADPDTLARFER